MLKTIHKILVSGFIFLTLGSANANVITSGCTLDPNRACSLAELVYNPSSYIQVDGARFNNFFDLNIAFFDASRIRVEAFDGFGNGNNPGNVVGLKFTAIDGLDNLLEAFSFDNYSVGKEIDYDLSIISGRAVNSSVLLTRFGNYTFSSGIYLDGGVRTVIGRGNLSEVDMSATCNQVAGAISTCQNRTAFTAQSFGPVRNLEISNNLFIDHTGAFGGRPDGMQIRSFEQYFSRFSVPEPGVLPLLMIGIAAFGVASRRMRAQSMQQPGELI